MVGRTTARRSSATVGNGIQRHQHRVAHRVGRRPRVSPFEPDTSIGIIGVWRSLHAGAVDALIRHRALTAVVAIRAIGDVRGRATRRRTATIGRARVAIVASQRRTTHAGARRARIIGRTRVAIVAGSGVVRVNAAGGRIAGVCRAHSAVIATDRREHAPARGVARVGRADVAVVTDHRGTAHASAIGASVTGVVRADVSIIAAPAGQRCENTSAAGVATIRGTCVAIRAVDRHGAGTNSAAASVIRRTCVLVITRGEVVAVPTTTDRIARIVSAQVSVIAIRRRTRAHASSVGAGIDARRADVVVVTRHRVVVTVNTARRRIARVVGANVVVVAIRRRTTCADSTSALVRLRAGDLPRLPAGRRVWLLGQAHPLVPRRALNPSPARSVWGI